MQIFPVGMIVSCLFILSPSLNLAACSDDQTEKAVSEETVRKQRSDWAEIRLSGSFPESSQLPGLFGDLVEGLATAKDRLQQAARDKSIRGVLLRIDGLEIGWAKLNELQSAVRTVRTSGKPVWAVLHDASTKDYLLAAACDRIVMPESGTLMLTGLRAEVTFYRNLFEMLDIKAEMLRVGAYKSAAEPYTRTEMSAEFRQEMEGILDDYYTSMIQEISTARTLSADRVSALIDQGLIGADQAKTAGLVDMVAYDDQLVTLIAEGNPSLDVRIRESYRRKKINTSLDMFSLMELLAGNPGASGSNRPRIAVLHLEGAIVSGNDPMGFLSESVISSDRIVPLIHKLAQDDNVRAIVLRVDSPGGSALASDLIWRALEACGKPVVASMGDTAASGGYYISMGADTIFAEPGTLTGSIGVVGGKIAVEGLLKKVGVTTSVIRRGRNSGVLSLTEGFTESERTAMQEMLNRTYQQFTEKAAAGRKQELSVLEPLARGRVYTGRQAKQIGLVDQLGTLADAIDHARSLCGDAEKKLEIEDLPRPQSPLEMLMGQQQAAKQPFDVWAMALPIALQPSVGELPSLRLMMDEPNLVLMPCRIRIE